MRADLTEGEQCWLTQGQELLSAKARLPTHVSLPLGLGLTHRSRCLSPMRWAQDPAGREMAGLDHEHRGMLDEGVCIHSAFLT